MDVLVSMATYSSGEEGMCRPRVTASEFPYLEIKDGRHPCVIQTFTGGDFIPNDVIINSDRVWTLCHDIGIITCVIGWRG